MARCLVVLFGLVFFSASLAAQDGPALVVQAEEAYASGRTTEAMQLADAAISAGGLDQFELGKAYAYRGKGLLMGGELERAIADFDASEQQFGRNPFSYGSRAMAYYLMADDEKAWDNADAVLDFDSWNAEALLFRGLASWHLGDSGDAIDDLEDAVTAAEQRGLMSAALGAVVAAKGDSEGALEHYRDAASAPIPAIRELATLGMMAARGGDRDRSLELFCIAAEINPGDGELLGAMAMSGFSPSAC